MMASIYKELLPVEFNEEEKRCALVMALINSQGKLTNKELCNILGLNARFVQRIRKRLEVDKENPRAIIKRKEKEIEDQRKARDENFISKVESEISRDPSMSIASLARKFDVDRKTMSRCISEDLRCKSYRLQTGQFLSEKMREKRLNKSKKLLNKLKKPKEPNMIWFFSDEKNFCQDQKFNRQNNRWIAMRPQDVPRVMQTKFPATVMVFEVISSEGHVMPPHIFEAGLRVTSEIYLTVMKEVVLPWIKKVAKDRPWVWQQDSAPCHVSKKSLEWLAENCYDFISKDIWPPSSPDLNPMDYFFWGVLEARTNRSAHPTKTALINTIRKEAMAIPKPQILAATARFRSRVEAVIEANGSYIE